jgi:hypothetical protein
MFKQYVKGKRKPLPKQGLSLSVMLGHATES